MRDTVRNPIFIATNLMITALVCGFIAFIAIMGHSAASSQVQDTAAKNEMRYLSDMYPYDGKIVPASDILEVATSYTTTFNYAIYTLDASEKYPSDGLNSDYYINLNDENVWTGPGINRAIGSAHLHSNYKAYLVRTREVWESLKDNGISSVGLTKETITAAYPEGQFDFGEEFSDSIYGIVFFELA